MSQVVEFAGEAETMTCSPPVFRFVKKSLSGGSPSLSPVHGFNSHSKSKGQRGGQGVSQVVAFAGEAETMAYSPPVS